MPIIFFSATLLVLSSQSTYIINSWMLLYVGSAVMLILLLQIWICCCFIDFAAMFKSQTYILNIWMLPCGFCCYVDLAAFDLDASDLDTTMSISYSVNHVYVTNLYTSHLDVAMLVLMLC